MSLFIKCHQRNIFLLVAWSIDLVSFVVVFCLFACLFVCCGLVAGHHGDTFF